MKRPADDSLVEPDKKVTKLDDETRTLLGEYERILEGFIGTKPSPSLVKEELEKRFELQKSLTEQVNEMKVRENALLLRLSTKEQEVNQLNSEVQDLLQCLTSSYQPVIHNTLLNPTVNMLFTRLKEELESYKEQLKQAREDAASATFTRDSHQGRQLITRMRLIQNENEELGKQLSEGKINNLEVQTTEQQEILAFYKQQLDESDNFVEDCLAQLDKKTDQGYL
eukprot:TRINITY_DN2154_c0_g1_i1.p1 TRINITY_DN2154_c0_g1~~TRINITY_DN2154_c0_g1_i1.p1  ORF type:complete len:225 (-),score=54.99 TRINITY_DN2154_c0_g1_i1:210-884(-)